MRLASDRRDALLLHQLAAAVQAGAPLAPVTQALAGDTTLTTTQRLSYEALSRRLTEGLPLGKALPTGMESFTAEAGAWLDGTAHAADKAAMLRAIAADQELRSRGRARLRLALIWPTFLAAVACFLFAVISIFVAPALRAAFEAMGSPLPPITQQMFSGESDQWLFVGWQPGFLLGVLLLCVLLTYTRAEVNRPLVRAGYSVGLLKRTERAAFTARVLALIGQVPARMAGPALAHLAAAGLVAPLHPKALALRTALESGQPWGKALQVSEAVALHISLHLQLAEQAEAASASVLQMLQQQALEDWDDALARFERNVVGLVYFGVASLIGTLTVAVYLPIFKMGQLI